MPKLRENNKIRKKSSKIKTKFTFLRVLFNEYSFFLFFSSFGALLKEFLLKIKPTKEEKILSKREKFPLELYKSNEMVHAICDDGVML